MQNDKKNIYEANAAKLESAINDWQRQLEPDPTPAPIELDLEPGNPTFVGLKEMGEDGQVKYKPDFYSDAIIKLAEASDREAGVVWKIDETNNTIIRDARNARGLEQNSIYGQLATAFNSCRAADRMIRLKEDGIRGEGLSEEEQNRIAEIQKLITEIADRVIKGEVESIDLSALNGELSTILRGDGRYSRLSEDKLLKSMNDMKDLACLEDRKYNICTVYNQKDGKGQDKIVFEAEAIIPPISNEMLANDGSKDSVTAAQKNAFNKSAVAAYWPTLTAQETIPTQCLGTMPGIRNGYVKFIGEVGTERKSWCKSIHSGTVSSGLKVDGDRNKVASDNVEHIASSISDERIIFTTLNSPVRSSILYFTPIIGWLAMAILKMFSIVKKENNAYYQLNKAVKNKGDPKVKRALTPLNKMRFIAGQKVRAYDEALVKLGGVLPAEYSAVGKYLQGQGSEKEAYKSLENIGDLTVRATLMEAIRTKSAVNESFVVGAFRTTQPDDKGMSRSLRQTAGMIALTSLVNSGVLGEGIKMPIIAYHCKSGKDRTGAASIEANRRIMSAILGVNDVSSQTAKDNLDNQLKAGHTAKLAEIAGGTPGSIGIRPNPGLEDADTYGDKLAEICLETARNNKIEKSRRGRLTTKASSKRDTIVVSKGRSSSVSNTPNFARARTVPTPRKGSHCERLANESNTPQIKPGNTLNS